jgi:hypothetical protein
MDILTVLKNNKGTVSSALGKEIASEILQGKYQLLEKIIPLVAYNLKNEKDKNIRAGAAKVVECVAEKRADLISPYIAELINALEVEEPQTKWMIFMALGYCAKGNENSVKHALIYAKKYINQKKDGQLCLLGAIDLFLGYYGEISEKNAAEVFPLLLESSDNTIYNEQDWILEGFIRIAPNLTKKDKDILMQIANEYKENSKKATQKRAEKLLKICV